MTEKKKQTRRAIYFSDNSYQKLKKYCEENDISMSSWLEDQATKLLGTNSAAGSNGNSKFTDNIFEMKIKKELPKKADKKPIGGSGTHFL
jgi:hypothetical protein